MWDIVVPLCLVKIAGDRVSELVLLGKLGDVMFAATLARKVTQMGLFEGHVSRLFEQQKHVAVQLCKHK